LLYAQFERIHYQFLLDAEAYYCEWMDLFSKLLKRYDIDLCYELLVEVKTHSQKLNQANKYEIELLEGELNLAEYDPLSARSKFEFLVTQLDMAQYPTIIARALKGLGECATNNCTFDSSSLSLNLQRWENGIQLSPSLDKNQELTGSLLENLGQTCELLGMHSKAEEYYNQAKILYEKNDLRSKLADLLEKIGMLYREQYRSNEALATFKEGLAIREKLQDLWGIGRIYNKMALVYGDLRKAGEAENLYLKSMGYLEKINDPASLASVYGGFAWFKFITRDLSPNNLQIAEEYVNKAIEISEDKGFGRGLSKDYHTLFHITDLRKGAKEAEPFIRKSCDYARRYADPFMFFDTLVHVAKFDYERGEYSKLYGYLNEIEDYERRGAKFSVFKGRLLVLLGHVALRESRLSDAIEYYQSGWSIIVQNRNASTVPPLPKEFSDFVDQIQSISSSNLEKQQIGLALGNTLNEYKSDAENWDKVQTLIHSMTGDK